MRIAFPDWPLRDAPRWFAAVLLGVLVIAGVWSAASLGIRSTAHSADIEQRLEAGQRVDMDLYRAVNARVASGEDYYAAATEANREFTFPTKPFVTVRTPVLAWTSAIWGEWGWRIIAAILWGANIVAWFAALDKRVSPRERDGAAALSAVLGVAAFIPEIGYSHEILAGLFVSLALALSATRLWAAGLVLAVFGIALRELALPFLLAWAAIAMLAGRPREFPAVIGALALLGIGLWLHARGVAGARLPGDSTSPGWLGMIGPSLPLFGINQTTLLQVLPNWLAGPLGVLSLLGWLAWGGRTGAFAALWFAGFIAAVAIFGRQEHFYWMGLFVPAYGVGLAFVPRALAQLWAVLTGKASASPTP